MNHLSPNRCPAQRFVIFDREHMPVWKIIKRIAGDGHSDDAGSNGAFAKRKPAHQVRLARHGDWGASSTPLSAQLRFLQKRP